MANVIFAKHFNIGGREIYEDRVEVAEFTTVSGLHLQIAVVADGVGGQDKGERASQIAVDAIVRYVRNSTDRDMPSILVNALSFANTEIYEEAQEEPYRAGMCTTGAVAVLVDHKLVYIANVGDSRVYLCRGGRLTQLSMDHTYATHLVQREGYSWDEAAVHPNAQVVTRALGMQESVQVDLGFYVGTDDPDTASRRGEQGLPIKEGDSILVCSDGLIKNSPRTGQPLIRDDEIITVLSNEEGEKAARTIVAFALGRDPDDNVSVALLQIPDPARHGRRTRRLAMIVGSIVVVMLCLVGLLAFVASRLVKTSDELSNVAAEATRSAFEGTSIAETIAAFTPTAIPPTATLRPPPIPGEIAALFNEGMRTPMIAGQVIDIVDSASLISVNHRQDLTDGDDAHLYALPATTLALDSVTDDRAALTITEGSQIFMQSGRYVGGVQVRIEPSGVLFSTQGSCMGITTPDPQKVTEVSAACYEGLCTYVLEFGTQPVPIPSGQRVLIDLQTRTVVTTTSINQSEAIGVASILREFGEGGRADIERCLKIYLPAPPTVTPVPLATLVTPGTPNGTPASTGLPTEAPVGTSTDAPISTQKPVLVTPTAEPY